MRTLRLLPTYLAAVALFALPAHADDSGTKSAKAEEAAGPKKTGEIGAKNAIFIEGFGNGLVYSINYDRRLLDMLSVRIGLTYFTKTLLSPILPNLLLGSLDHKFEFGLGPTVLYATDGGVMVAGSGALGYRYSPADGGVFFRVNVVGAYFLGEFRPWPGLSLGAVF